MTTSRLSGLHQLSMTGYLFGLLYDCPNRCSKDCPLASLRQVDLLTTFYYIKTLSRDDKMWLISRYERCPGRQGQTAPGSRQRRRDAGRRVFGKQVAAST
jgi:hypothetical protein